MNQDHISVTKEHCFHVGSLLSFSCTPGRLKVCIYVERPYERIFVGG